MEKKTGIMIDFLNSARIVVAVIFLSFVDFLLQWCSLYSYDFHITTSWVLSQNLMCEMTNSVWKEHL